MAITFAEKEKKKTILLAILVILIIGAALLLVFLVLMPKIEKSTEREIPKLPLLEIDFSVLENPIFEELEPPQEVELPEEFGRENPFLPY